MSEAIASPPSDAPPAGNAPLQGDGQPQEAPDGYTYYLPHYTIGVNIFEGTTANGLAFKEVVLLDTPNQDYLARRINSGEEFAIGGDKRHVVQSLALELARRPEERWHIIAIKDINLTQLNAPRRAYSMYPHVFDDESRAVYDTSLDVPGQEGIRRPEVIFPAAEALLVPGTDYFPPRGRDGTYNDGGNDFKEILRAKRVVVNGESAQRILNLTADNLPFIGSGEPQPDFNFNFDPNAQVFNGGGDPQQNMVNNDGMMQGVEMHGGQVHDPLDPFNSLQDRAGQFPQDVNRGAELPFPAPPFQSGEELTPEQHEQVEQWRRDFREWKKNQRATQKKERQEQDEATIKADLVWASYIGTNLCRWCGRRGHEAVECIKWDPDHLDKLVCVQCNNKKHFLDECPAFQNLPLEKKEKLLLLDGAHRPGVRSLYWDWVCFPHATCAFILFQFSPILAAESLTYTNRSKPLTSDFAPRRRRQPRQPTQHKRPHDARVH